MTIFKNFDRTNAIIGGLVWLVAITVYAMTKAPTLSFWDCGEFIAVSHILGIPHPPGTPLYVLVGRIFSMLPLYTDLSARVNFLSSVSSSFTTLFGYLAAVRMLNLWFDKDRSVFTRILIYGGSACGAFFLAFGFTNWTNSIEAEVYGMSMMIMVFMFWLTLVYFEHRGTALADRIMLLIVYLAFLGIGVHMMIFLIMPLSALFFILKKDTPIKHWFLMAAFFIIELYLIFALSSRANEIPYYVPVIIVFVFYAFYVFSFDRVPRYLFIVGLAYLLAIAPVFAYVGAAVKAKMSDGGAVEVVPSSGLQIVGIIGLLALAGLGVYNLYQYLTNRNKKDAHDMHLLHSAVFILVTFFMVGVLKLNIRGFENFLLLSALVTAVLVVLVRQYLRWPILIAVLGISLIIIGIMPFIYGMIISAAAVLVLGLGFKVKGWRIAMLIFVATIIGYSVHAFVPIRSAQNPFINENNPSQSLDATMKFLERKQYGSQNMIDRMFVRRAEWGNQFGNYRRMGFWHFFDDQYGIHGLKFIIIFLVGIYGIWEIIRRRSEVGLFFLVLLLLSSVGLILYMNFADGTRQNPVTGVDYLEVRDRDYFFTPAFILFGLAIGFGLTVLIQFVRESVSKFNPGIRSVICGALLILFLTPIYAFSGNYFKCDRSKNFAPYDYAWDLLQSARPNAVFFTTGDNDTFPLWCLQLVYGIRTDVKNVNLSLANTSWYIHQVQDPKYMGINLGWTDSQIKSLRPLAYQDGRRQGLANLTVDAIIDHNKGKIPIDFSITTASRYRAYQGRTLDTALELSGFKWYIKKNTGSMTVNVDETYNFLMDSSIIKLRGLNDPFIYKDEATIRVTTNIANSYSVLMDTLGRAGDYERAEKVGKFIIEKIPYADDPVHSMAMLYAQQKKVDSLAELIRTSEAGNKVYLNILLGTAYRLNGDNEAAEQTLLEVMATNPNNRDVFEELLRIYYADGDNEKIKGLLQQWLRNNPDDQRVRQFLQQIQAAPPAKDS